jgi:hypothetical protein
MSVIASPLAEDGDGSNDSAVSDPSVSAESFTSPLA